MAARARDTKAKRVAAHSSPPTNDVERTDYVNFGYYEVHWQADEKVR
ncbi:unnamed protein product [Fusarium graminearum]|uniref:Chromosome 1, complete genome n=1 Tax=Gibberella zeae (strain ATCC MYA-4620 / CBS 123657 / FGSC 9075 / NRRL 31084 / PH-1) TaxID=229533 RepID=I1S4L0_GIBZE|nr:hypothetical protein FGSG_11778 [Fusarium graminearum PH-1]ESU05725.1 hypothetical protein FGSG_11778 [Fusarium graminearum PH-1]CEF72480.1 unnamed protein product [Fusarium graminearum]CZS75744.1 unnamed protein product [Fusarium graminearum]|eukprot:XP_011316210.1 hypothetical protein FGSG_11778 [Fusarium graminearum PH-1]